MWARAAIHIPWYSQLPGKLSPSDPYTSSHQHSDISLSKLRYIRIYYRLKITVQLLKHTLTVTVFSKLVEES